MWCSLKQMILSVFNRSYECSCKYIFVELILWYFFGFIKSVTNKVNLTNELKNLPVGDFRKWFQSSFYTVLRGKCFIYAPTSPIKMQLCWTEKKVISILENCYRKELRWDVCPGWAKKYDDVIVNSPSIVLKCSSCEWIWNWLFGWTEFCNENFNVT